MNIVFVRPTLDDVESALVYANELIEEEAYLTIQKKLTIDEERKWLREIVQKMEAGDFVCLFAKDKRTGELVANGEVGRAKSPATHIATIGISVKKKYRNQGVGSALLKRLVEEGKKMEGIQIIHLDVFSENEKAKRFYERNGFKGVARIPNWVNFHGRLLDRIVMYYEGIE